MSQDKETHSFPCNETQLKVEGPVPIATQHALSVPITKAAQSSFPYFTTTGGVIHVPPSLVQPSALGFQPVES